MANVSLSQLAARNMMELHAQSAIMAISSPMEVVRLATVQLRHQLIISNTIAQFRYKITMIKRQMTQDTESKITRVLLQLSHWLLLLSLPACDMQPYQTTLYFHEVYPI